jgi:hypothetical protein
MSTVVDTNIAHTTLNTYIPEKVSDTKNVNTPVES